MRKQLIMAGVVAATLTFGACTEKGASNTVVDAGGVESSVRKIVYVNTDSLMSKYEYAQELNEAFLQKQEERRGELNIKARALEVEAAEFQRKLQTNAFLSEQRAVEARDNLLSKEQNLQRLQQEMMDKMNVEQQEMNKKLFDEVTAFLKVYTKQKGYDMVLTTTLGGNVLYSVDGYDITEDVVEKLNDEYEKK